MGLKWTSFTSQEKIAVMFCVVIFFHFPCNLAVSSFNMWLGVLLLCVQIQVLTVILLCLLLWGWYAYCFMVGISYRPAVRLNTRCNMMENIGILVMPDFHYLMLVVGHTALEQPCMGWYCLFDWKRKGQLFQWSSKILLFRSQPCILDIRGSQSPHLTSFFNNWHVQTDISLYTYRVLDVLLQEKKIL